MSPVSDKSLAAAAAIGLCVAACSNPPPDVRPGADEAPKPLPEVVSAQKAIETPDIPTIDPMSLNDTEIDKVLDESPRCYFSYTAASPPVLATGLAKDAVTGVVKIHGKLVELTGTNKKKEALAEGGTYSAGPLTAVVERPEGRGAEDVQDDEPTPATMHFELTQGLNVGYRGWLSCTAETADAS